MIKRYYILDYPENRQYRDKINSLGFHQAVNQEQSNQAREKNVQIRHVVRAGGFLQVVNLNRELENSRVGTKKNYMEAFDIFPCYMMKFLCYSCSQL